MNQTTSNDRFVVAFPLPLRLLARGCWLLAAAVAGAGAIWSLCREPARVLADQLLRDGSRAPTRLSFEEALTGGCALVVLACVLWLVVVTGVAVVSEVLRAARVGMRAPATLGALPALPALADRICPALVRALVASALGAAVTTVAAAAAPADAPGAGSAVDGLTGLALPDRVVAPSGPTVARAVERRSPRTVLVRPGDSLWSIATALLPPRPTDQRVTVAWHRLYRANGDPIGADPDLILPGTPLTVPPLRAPRRKDRP